MEALIYIANCLYLTSYLVQDMLRLRLLTLVAATCLMTYFYARPEPMLTVVCWNLVFIGLNVIQLARLIARRRTEGNALRRTRGAGALRTARDRRSRYPDPRNALRLQAGSLLPRVCRSSHGSET